MQNLTFGQHQTCLWSRHVEFEKSDEVAFTPGAPDA